MSFAHGFRSTLTLAAAAVLIAGCAKTDGTGAKAGKDTKGSGQEVAKKKDEPKHEGWWCDEHGVPEKECSMCLPEAEVKKRFKDAGDWCKEHDRAKSQCFICEASLWDKYKAQYKAKEGKDPPLPEKNMPKKKDDK